MAIVLIGFTVDIERIGWRPPAKSPDGAGRYLPVSLATTGARASRNGSNVTK